MKLEEWSKISDQFADAIIIGNGASAAIHEAFTYRSLWDAAITEGFVSEGLVQLADQLKTGANVELLLRQLWTAEAVDKEFGIDTVEIEKAYAELRTGLIQTVRKIHCSHADVIQPIDTASDFLRHFKTVFSLNYDLLAYWAIMASNDSQIGHRFKDCFNKGYFDDDWERFREPIGQQDSCTLVFYPHGALQFVQRNEGIDRKVDSTHSFGDLLEHVLDLWERTSLLPLFVTEGDSARKMRSIQRSSYLSNVYYEALPNSGPTLVIYGWSMNEDVDGHLLKQLAKGNYRKIAVSVHLPTTDDVDEYVTLTKAKLRHIGVGEVTFFDAESEGCWIHPVAGTEVDAA